MQLTNKLKESNVRKIISALHRGLCVKLLA